MKIAMLITTFNRPEYLLECLKSVMRADTSKLDTIVVVDDFSTDYMVPQILDQANTLQPKIRKLEKFATGKGIKNSLMYGCDYLFGQGYDLIINLDGDAIVRNDFVDRLLEGYQECLSVITGFHSTTRNSNGTERHHVLKESNLLYFKQSVGGINLMFNRKDYEQYIRPKLCEPEGNWDHEMSKALGGVYCLKESVVEHIGLVSSMGHGGGKEMPDTADNFVPLTLPDVTLFGVDCEDAIKRSCKQIKFAKVVLMDKFKTIEDYNQFMFKKLYTVFDTSHILTVQPDGWVVRPLAWKPEWLANDYIGAIWYHYKDFHRVGNGGFSLRSQRLCEILWSDNRMQLMNDSLINNLAEDHNICRTWRVYLEALYYIKFANENVAGQFSYEGYGINKGEREWSGQFGFHGKDFVKQFI